MKTLAIIGSGDLGQQIAYYAVSDNHFDRVVFIDDFSDLSEKNGISIIGRTNQLDELYAEGMFDEIIIGIGYKHIEKKKEFFDLIEERFPIGKIIHSTAWVDSTAIIKAGCIIYPCCNIDANCIIAENTIVNIGCTIAHDSLIERHCFLSPRVAIAGFVTVGSESVIGINSTIIDNISIVSQTRLGGGTVVIKNIVKSGLYVANPARFVR